ncbi:cys/Met metabolism PLP-dependent enzyme family protein, partial [Vibrio parahaemolyticus V-223/04]
WKFKTFQPWRASLTSTISL